MRWEDVPNGRSVAKVTDSACSGLYIWVSLRREPPGPLPILPLMGRVYLKPEFPPLLKPGRHVLSLNELRSLCVASKKFGLSITRKRLQQNLEVVIEKLSAATIIGEVWIDGSYLTEKIDPDDVDVVLRVASDIYDTDAEKRAVVDWASSPELRDTHSCHSLKWIEYSQDHPLFTISESDRIYFNRLFTKSIRNVRKGVVIIPLPAVFT